MISALDLVCGIGLLKTAGVEKIFKLEPCNSTPGNARCCFFLRSENTTQVRLASDLILADIAAGRTREYIFIVTPRLTTGCEILLEECGVYGNVTILECPIFFFPIDIDILSLERPNLSMELFLHRSHISYFDIAKSIQQIVSLFGCKVNLWGQGNVSRDVIRLVNILNTENNESTDDFVDPTSQVDLLVIDRDVDMVSLLLSQMCYQGVLDEEFEIEAGKVLFPKEVVGKAQGVKHILHGNDPVFSEMRDWHISAVFGRLKERSTSLKRMQSSRENMNIGEMQDFIATKLKGVQNLCKSLNLHISACEYIKNRKEEGRFANQLQIERDLIQGLTMKDSIGFIEDFIYKQVNPLTALRLMCLLCVVQDGLSSKQYRSLSKIFCQSFGHEHLITLFNLKKLKLFYESNLTSILAASGLTESSAKRRFREISKKLNLIPSLAQDVICDPKNPKDESYVFGGVYNPIVCTLAESMANGPNEWKEITNFLSNDSSDSTSTCTNSIRKEPCNERIMAVYFIGGATYAEITALRFWAKRKGYKLAIFTTSLTSGSRLMRELMPIK